MTLESCGRDHAIFLKLGITEPKGQLLRHVPGADRQDRAEKSPLAAGSVIS
jgi:hypothetical protein